MIRALCCVVFLAVTATAQLSTVTIRGPREAVAFGRHYTVDVIVRHEADLEVVAPAPTDFIPLVVDGVARTGTLQEAGIVTETFVANARAESTGNVTLLKFTVRLKDRSGAFTTIAADPISVAVATALLKSDGIDLDPIAPYVHETSWPWWWLFSAALVVCGSIAWRLRRPQDGMSAKLARLHAQLALGEVTIEEAWPIIVAASSQILSRDASTLTAFEWASELGAGLEMGHAEVARRVAASRDAVAFGSQRHPESLIEDTRRLVEILRQRLERSR